MKFTLMYIFISMGLLSYSQSVISTAGNSTETEDFNIDFTIGEIITKTYQADELDMTQGFHQPQLKISIIHQPVPSDQIRLYPNPTYDFAILELPKLDQEYYYDLYDTDGKLIIQEKIQQKKTEIDLSNLATAIYFLRVKSQSNKKIKVYKIIKSK